MKNVVVSSNNKGKLAEISAIFESLPYKIISFEAFNGYALDIDEDGQTYEENAIKKVQPCESQAQCIFLADDSGLSVDVLNGRPGIHSARYAGPDATVEVACQKMLNELAGQTNRKAHFVCCIALKFPNGEIKTTTGILPGTIALTMRGTNGFGFDPIFIPDGYSKTMAELSAAEKNRISHRYRALIQAKNLVLSQ